MMHTISECQSEPVSGDEDDPSDSGEDGDGDEVLRMLGVSQVPMPPLRRCHVNTSLGRWTPLLQLCLLRQLGVECLL